MFPSDMLLFERKTAQKSVKFVYSTKNIIRPTDIKRYMNIGMSNIALMNFEVQLFFF